MNQAEDITAYTIHCLLEDGFSSEEHTYGWHKPDPKFPVSLGDAVEIIVRKSNDQHASFVKHVVNSESSQKIIQMKCRADGEVPQG